MREWTPPSFTGLLCQPGTITGTVMDVVRWCYESREPMRFLPHIVVLSLGVPGYVGATGDFAWDFAKYKTGNSYHMPHKSAYETVIVQSIFFRQPNQKSVICRIRSNIMK